MHHPNSRQERSSIIFNVNLNILIIKKGYFHGFMLTTRSLTKINLRAYFNPEAGNEKKKTGENLIKRGAYISNFYYGC